MSTRQIAISKVEPNGALPALAAELLEQAAKGNLHAQRRIREAWADELMTGGPLRTNADLMASSGLFVARMCAANGDISDAESLAALLLNTGIYYHDGGRVALGCSLIAEGLAVYERMSAAGHQQASDAVDKLVLHLPPEVVARAQLLAKRRKESGDATSDPQR